MRLKIHVEGPTERRFTELLLAPHLSGYGYEIQIIINRTSRNQRGGLSHYQQFRKNTLSLKEHNPCLITTMIDFYQLPMDFPGRNKIADISAPLDKVLYLEQQLKADISELSPYFIPYIQLHEFEALLFSDIQILETELEPENPKVRVDLRKILQTYREPENINTKTGPAKHLRELSGGTYQKTFHGISIAEKIGLETMREHCPHFDQWLKQVELFSCNNR